MIIAVITASWAAAAVLAVALCRIAAIGDRALPHHLGAVHCNPAGLSEGSAARWRPSAVSLSVTALT
jgi:hypothetical protein